MKRRPPPWWFCCGWWSPLCVLDTAMHALHLKWQRVCDAHDRLIMGDVAEGEDWLDALPGEQARHHFETLEPVDVVGPPKVVVIPAGGLSFDFTTGKVMPTPQTWGTGATTTWTYRP